MKKTPTFAKQFIKNTINMNNKDIQLLKAILAKLNAIADALGIDDPVDAQTLTENSNLNFSPAKLLPPELKKKLKDEVAFKNAFLGEKPLLYLSKGKIETNITSKKLMGYLLGRFFAGDFPETIFDKTIWQDGGDSFPFTDISAIFKVDYIVRESRSNGLNRKVPKGAHLIDKYFGEKK